VIVLDLLFTTRGVINQGTAHGFGFFGLAGNSELNLRAVTPLLGVIYAPRAACTITGEGSAAAEIHGLIICPTLTLGNNVPLHYDEALNQ
jgi:hypothetical protein